MENSIIVELLCQVISRLDILINQRNSGLLPMNRIARSREKVSRRIEDITKDIMHIPVRLSPQWMYTLHPKMFTFSVQAMTSRTASTARTRLISLWPIAWLVRNISACLRSVYHLFCETCLRMPELFDVDLNRNVSVKKINGELNITIAEKDLNLKM